MEAASADPTHTQTDQIVKKKYLISKKTKEWINPPVKTQLKVTATILKAMKWNGCGNGRDLAVAAQRWRSDRRDQGPTPC